MNGIAHLWRMIGTPESHRGRKVHVQKEFSEQQFSLPRMVQTYLGREMARNLYKSPETDNRGAICLGPLDNLEGPHGGFEMACSSFA
jgi:hypothetical protein